MKEGYLSPEVKLVSFVAREHVASLNLNFNDFLVAGTQDTDNVSDPNAVGDVKTPVTGG